MQFRLSSSHSWYAMLRGLLLLYSAYRHYPLYVSHEQVEWSPDSVMPGTRCGALDDEVEIIRHSDFGDVVANGVPHLAQASCLLARLWLRRID